MFFKIDTFIQGHERKGKIVEKSDTTNPSSGKFNRTLLAIDIWHKPFFRPWELQIQARIGQRLDRVKSVSHIKKKTLSVEVR